MARPSGIGTITAAAVVRLKADAGVTALVAARIYNSPRANEPYPYLRVSVRTEQDDDTVGRAGVDAVLEVLIVSTYDGEKETGEIASAVRSCLELAPLAVAGFTAPADVLYAQGLDAFEQVIGGVRVRHRPLWFRVRVT